MSLGQRPVPQSFPGNVGVQPITLPATQPQPGTPVLTEAAQPRELNKPSPVPAVAVADRTRSVSSARAAEVASASRVAANSGHFNCPDTFGFYPHHKSCDKYWACENGTATLKLCGNGLVFDDSDSLRENCAYPFSVDCGSRTDLGMLSVRVCADDVTLMITSPFTDGLSLFTCSAICLYTFFVLLLLFHDALLV